MQDVGFAFIQLGYHLGLAVIIGGGLALGPSASPAILRRYDGLATIAVVVVWITTYFRASGFETPDVTHYIRWAALALMGVLTLYATAWSGPVARALQQQTRAFDELAPRHPVRLEVHALHARARRALDCAVILGIVALFLS
ncbi:MAG: hypothetical protein HY071_00380 [Chloroflexi bacterium]|nr:hypothetical protein [Chloroflexota bacterium]